MPRKPPQVYDVVRAQDDALVVIGVDLATARAECARLNAEARIPIAAHDPLHPEPRRPTGMVHGELVRYEARSKEGLTV